MNVIEVHEDDGPGLVRMVAGLRRLKAGDWRGVASDFDIPRPDLGEIDDADIYDEAAAYLVESVLGLWVKVARQNATPKVAAALRGLSEASKAALLAWIRGGV